MARRPATDMQMEFSARLRAIRVARGFKTQVAFADRLEVQQKRVSAWENGHSTPDSLELLQRVCDLLGVTADFLLFGDARTLSPESYKALVVEAAIS